MCYLHSFFQIFESAQEWTQGMGVKKRSTWMKDMQALGKKRASQMNISFNKDFYQTHNFYVQKDHWKHFCIYLGLGEDPAQDCEPCARVLAEASMSLDMAAGIVPDGSCASRRIRKRRLFKNEEMEGDPCKPKRGRPAKDEDRRVNVWEWLDAERPGKYTRLDPAEADRQRVRCELCKATLNVGRNNTNWFIVQHELCSKHKLSISKEDGTTVPCNGIHLKEDIGLQEVDNLYPAYITWASAGFPWLTGHVAHCCNVGDGGEIVLRSSKCPGQNRDSI